MKKLIFVLFNEDHLEIHRDEEIVKLSYKDKSSHIFDDIKAIITYGITPNQYQVLNYLSQKHVYEIEIKDILKDSIKYTNKNAPNIFDLKHIQGFYNKHDKSLINLGTYYQTLDEFEILKALFEDSKEIIRFMYDISKEFKLKPKYTSLQSFAKYIVLSNTTFLNEAKPAITFDKIMPIVKLKNNDLTRGINVIYNTLYGENVRMNTFKSISIKYIDDDTVIRNGNKFIIKVVNDNILNIALDATGISYMKQGVYTNNIHYIDFNNFYPSIVVNNTLAPRIFSDSDFLKVFMRLYHMNNFIEISTYSVSYKKYFKKMMNSIIGKSLSKKCKWRDEGFWFSIILKGAIIMLELIDILLFNKAEILHINKDGVIFKLEKDIDDQIKYFIGRNSYFYTHKVYNKAIIYSLNDILLIGEEDKKTGIYDNDKHLEKSNNHQEISDILYTIYKDNKNLSEIIAEKDFSNTEEDTIFADEIDVFVEKIKKYIL